MQCLILAGGLGTRIDRLADGLPKSLISVAGRPFIDHQLEWLAAGGVDQVVISIGHRGAAIRAFVGDGGRWGLTVVCIDEGGDLLGTGGAVRLAVDRGVMAPGFFVLYGDSYLDVELSRVWAAADAGRKPLMTVFHNRGRWDRSNVVFRDGRVEMFEKGRDDAAEIGMDYIDYGLSVLTTKVVDERIEPGRPTDLAEVYHRLSRDGGLLGFEATRRFHEIGSPEGLADLEAHLAGDQD